MDIDEQRSDIQRTVHQLDKRVAILETRSDQQKQELKDIRTDVKATHTAIGQVHSDLQKFMDYIGQDKAKTLKWVVTTLAAVVVSIALPLLMRGVA